MCIIIDRPPEHKLTMEILKRCAKMNADGWGIMYAKNGYVHTDRGMTWEGFEAAYAAAPQDAHMGIHFRIRTHGRTDIQNTHPYRVLRTDRHGADLWLMHNGVISIPTQNVAMSDTWHWVEKVARPMLRHRAEQLHRNKGLVAGLTKTVSSNRLLFLDGKGRFVKLNPQSWTEDFSSKCSFSNSTFRAYSNAAYGDGYGYAGGGSRSSLITFPDRSKQVYDQKTKTWRERKTPGPKPQVPAGTGGVKLIGQEPKPGVIVGGGRNSNTPFLHGGSGSPRSGSDGFGFDREDRLGNLADNAIIGKIRVEDFDDPSFEAVAITHVDLAAMDRKTLMEFVRRFPEESGDLLFDLCFM